MSEQDATQEQEREELAVANERYAERIRNGDTAAVNEMIVANEAFVNFMAQEVAEELNAAHLYEDFVDAGTIALVTAVQGIAKSTKSVRNFLYTCLRNAMLDEYATSPAYRPPRATVFKMLKRGEELSQGVTLEDADSWSATLQNGEILTQRQDRLDPGFAKVDAEDAIQARIPDERTRDFVRLRVEGYDDNEIKNALGVSRNTTRRMRSELAAAHNFELDDTPLDAHETARRWRVPLWVALLVPQWKSPKRPSVWARDNRRLASGVVRKKCKSTGMPYHEGGEILSRYQPKGERTP